MASKQVIIEGRNTIHDALISNKIITTILISKSVLNAQRIRDIENLALKKKTLIKKVSPDQIKHLSESGKAGGVIAYMELPEPPTLEKILQTKPNPFLILINKLDYEQNLGAILRSAWAAGVDAVLVGNSGIHDITPIVAKVSQGAVAHVPLIATSLFQSLAILKKYAVPVVGVEVDLGRDYSKQNLTGPIAFVFGGEAIGLSEPLKKYCDLFVHIPMIKSVASLNVSVATALVIFEKTRQERT